METIPERALFLKGSMLRGFGNSAERNPHRPFATQEKQTKRPCSLSESGSVQFCGRTHEYNFRGHHSGALLWKKGRPGGLYFAAKPGITSHPQDPTLKTCQPPSEPPSDSQA